MGDSHEGSNPIWMYIQNKWEGIQKSEGAKSIQ